jgi:hypothetical protein
MRYEIRKLAAVLGTAVLAAIIAFCPALLCAPPDISGDAHSCCPHSSHNQSPIPNDRAGQSCPYVLLEKAKSVPAPLAVSPLQVMAIAVPLELNEQIAAAPSYIPDAEGLYLRNRVLLI